MLNDVVSDAILCSFCASEARESGFSRLIFDSRRLKINREKKQKLMERN